MTTLQCKAFAKLNLTLDVLGRRDDGYHEMKMIMTSVELSDDINIMLSTGEGFEIECNMDGVPLGDDNLALLAAKRFSGATETDFGGIRINILKQIPPGSGMAGGSSDAAAVLNALNRHYGYPLDQSEMQRLGAELGSDVPYCLVGGTSTATGRGEILTPMKNLPPCHIVICRPDYAASTGEMFRRLDQVNISNNPNYEAAVAAIESGDLVQLGKKLSNVFEQVVDRPEIPDIKQTLLQFGALGATMTGTGSAVFGIFDSERKARQAARLLSQQYKLVFLTQNK